MIIGNAFCSQLIIVSCRHVQMHVKVMSATDCQYVTALPRPARGSPLKVAFLMLMTHFLGKSAFSCDNLCSSPSPHLVQRVCKECGCVRIEKGADLSVWNCRIWAYITRQSWISCKTGVGIIIGCSNGPIHNRTDFSGFGQKWNRSNLRNSCFCLIWRKTVTET